MTLVPDVSQPWFKQLVARLYWRAGVALRQGEVGGVCGSSFGQSRAEPSRLATSDYTAKMSDDEQEQTIAEDLVVTKYKMGGDIANRKLMSASNCR